MISSAGQGFRLHLALALLSAALIMIQLEQMQLLALLLWYHFAYFIISTALLGFGTAGTCIALWRAPLLLRLDWLAPLFMFCCAALMSLALPLTQALFRNFDPSLLFVDSGPAVSLLLGQLIYLLVFFLGALPLGLVFIRHSARIGSLYCANLIGSGVGGLAAVFLMYVLLPQELPAPTALLPWLAGMLTLPRGRHWLLVSGGLTLALLGATILLPPTLTPSPYKAVNRTLALPGAKLEAELPSPLGLVQAVTAPALRYAPGLSLTYREEIPELRGALFSSGDWFGAVLEGDASVQRASITALPYALQRPAKVLVLEAGTGGDIRQALDNGARQVTAVEPQQEAVRGVALLAGGHDPYGDPAVRRSSLAPRTWLALAGDRYDLITLPPVGSFGGGAGLYALQEQYLLTREGLAAMWQRLSPDGILCISAWLDSPPRTPLRLTATFAEMLTAAGLDFPQHLAAVRGWDMVTFVLTRAPLTAADVMRLRRFCAALQYDPLFLPGLLPAERSRYHREPAEGFFRDLDDLVRPATREKVYTAYPFNLRPVSDNHPFFSQFLRWQSIPHLVRLLGERTLPYLELGSILVALGFLQTAAMAAVLILLPLLRLGLPGQTKVQRWIFPFFSGLGLGYMFCEVVLIHELVLFFGHPIFAAATVISVLLFFSGLGSLCSSRLRGVFPAHALAAGLVALLLLLARSILPPLLHGAMAWPLPGKILLVLALIAPPAFVMGMPFPLGLERLAGRSKTQAAWAWGINGSFSVLGTGLAAILAVELGFSAVMLAACGAYGLAAAAGWKS